MDELKQLRDYFEQRSLQASRRIARCKKHASDAIAMGAIASLGNAASDWREAEAQAEAYDHARQMVEATMAELSKAKV